jgi:hypothetical protein
MMVASAEITAMAKSTVGRISRPGTCTYMAFPRSSFDEDPNIFVGSRRALGGTGVYGDRILQAGV